MFITSLVTPSPIDLLITGHQTRAILAICAQHRQESGCLHGQSAQSHPRRRFQVHVECSAGPNPHASNNGMLVHPKVAQSHLL